MSETVNLNKMRSMKFKPNNKSGGVVVELEPKESQLPAGSPSAVPAPAFMVANILVPVDFSDCSKKALQYAIPFARQFGATLTLLHAVPRYPAAPEVVLLETELVEAAEAQLTELGRTIDRAVPSRTLVRLGTPHLEIIIVAKEFSFDLIIISTHGHAGLARVFLGSTAEKVVRHAPCPVLVVRESEREFVPDQSLSAS
jgi:nucleotide-binding universal stress UspA family protein